MGTDDDARQENSALIARSVKGARRLQGLSQTELARRAGVDLASVYRVEKGESVRASTLKKIASGLQVIVEDLFIDNFPSVAGRSMAVHRAAAAKWYPGEDRRRRATPDKEDLSQEVGERRRLGRLGLVPWFMCPPLIIPENGPGIVLLEIYGENLETFNAEFYEDGALYVLKGGATVSAGGGSVDLTEGDWVSFKTESLTSMRVLPPYEVAVVMWIGATRRNRRRKG